MRRSRGSGAAAPDGATRSAIQRLPSSNAAVPSRRTLAGSHLAAMSVQNTRSWPSSWNHSQSVSRWAANRATNAASARTASASAARKRGRRHRGRRVGLSGRRGSGSWPFRDGGEGRCATWHGWRTRLRMGLGHRRARSPRARQRRPLTRSARAVERVGAAVFAVMIRGKSGQADASGPLELVLADSTRVALRHDMTIGRAPGSTLRLDDPAVSRRQARISVVGGEVLLEDAGSSYGTWLDGLRVDGRRPLCDGSRIRVGNQELLVERPRDEAEAGRTIVVPTGASPDTAP